MKNQSCPTHDLVDDPDNSVFNLVLEELLKEDISVVDQLEQIWETSLD